MEHLDGFFALGGRDLINNFTKVKNPGSCLEEGHIETSIRPVHYQENHD